MQNKIWAEKAFKRASLSFLRRILGLVVVSAATLMLLPDSAAAVGAQCVESCDEDYGVTLSTNLTSTPETWYQSSTSPANKNVHGIRLLDTWSADPGENMFVGGGFSPGAAETAGSLIAVQFDLDYSRVGTNSNHPDPDPSDNSAMPNTHWSATNLPAFFNTSWTKSGDAAGTINNAEESVQFMLPSDGNVSYYRIRSKIVDKDTTTFGANVLTGCATCNYSGTFVTGFEPNKAADGSTLTSWKTGNQGSSHAYWQVDFGATNQQAIRRIQLTYPAGSSNIPNSKGAVVLLASDDGTNWVHIASQPGTMTQVDNLYIPSFGSLGTDARYIRIQVIGNTTSGEAEFAEVSMSTATTQNDLRVNHRFKQSKPSVTSLVLGASTVEASTSTSTSSQTVSGRISYEQGATGTFVRENEFYSLNSTADQLSTSVLNARFGTTSTCHVGNNQQCAQLFVPDSSSLKAVKFWARRATNPLSDLRVEVRTTSGGLPTSTVLGSLIVPEGDLTTTNKEVFRTFASSLALTPGTTYALVFLPDAAANSNDYLVAQGAGDFYTKEDSATYNGTSWTKKPNADLGFITYSSITTESATIKLIDKNGSAVASASVTVNIDGTFSGSLNLPIGMATGKAWAVVEYSRGADTASLNQLLNSSFETGTLIADSWLASASSVQAVETYATAGIPVPLADEGIQWGAKVQKITASGSGAGVRQKNLVMWESDRVSASSYIYTPSGQTGRTAQACYSFDNDATYPHCGSSVALTAGGWTRVEHSRYLNTSSTSVLGDPVGISITVTNSVNGDIYYFEGAQFARQNLRNPSLEFYQDGRRGADAWTGNYCYTVTGGIFQTGPSTSPVDTGKYSCRANWQNGTLYQQDVKTNHPGVRHKATVRIYATQDGTGRISTLNTTQHLGCENITLTPLNTWITLSCEFTPTGSEFSLRLVHLNEAYVDTVTLDVCRNNDCSVAANLIYHYLPAGEGQQFTVQDTTPPSTPGTPTTANPTNDTTPTWTWTASTDASGIASYDVCWDTVAGGCANSSTTATNSFTHSSALAEGTWHIKVRAVDGNGVVGAYSGNGQTLVDSMAPSVPGMPATSTPTSDTTPSWTWSASTDSGSGLSHYALCWDTVAGGCTNSSTSTVNSFTHSVALAQGTWYFKVRAVDVAGNASAYSGNGAVVIDTTAPTTPGTPSTTTPTFDTTPVWTWTASTDAGSGLRSSNTYEVQWCQDSTFTGCGSNTDFTNTNSYTHVFTLSVGTWYFRTRAFDAAGNPSAFSLNGSVVIQASTDTQAPTVPGIPATTSPTNDNTPTWTWTASTDNVGVDHYMICWDTVAGGCANITTTPSNSYTHSTALADGVWYVKVRAVDQAGNSSAYSANASVQIDTTGPTVPGTPTAATPTSDTTPTWTWAASTDGGVGLDEYQICWDTVAGGCTNSGTAAANSFTHSTGLAQGTWYFKVRAADTLGNLSSYSANGSVLIDTTAPAAPGTPSTSTPTEDTTPTWTWAASTDSGSGLRSSNTYEVQWCQNSSFSGCTNSAFSNTNSYTHSANLALGTWYFRARAFDAAGNPSAWSSNGSVTIQDSTAPSTPGTPSTSSPTSDTTPTWTWTASTDSGSGLDHYEVCWDTISGGCANVASITTASYTHSLALAAGTWYFKVKAVDGAGNSSPYSQIGSVVIRAAASLASSKEPAQPAEEPAVQPQKPAASAPKKKTADTPQATVPFNLAVMSRDILADPAMILTLLALAGLMLLRRKLRRQRREAPVSYY